MHDIHHKISTNIFPMYLCTVLCSVCLYAQLQVKEKGKHFLCLVNQVPFKKKNDVCYLVGNHSIGLSVRKTNTSSLVSARDLQK